MSAAPTVQGEPAGLTRGMRFCLLIIQELIDASGGVSPSYAEIQRELCVSSKETVFRLIGCLIERGYLTRIRGRHRSLAVLRRVEMPEEPEFVGFFADPALAAQLAHSAA